MAHPMNVTLRRPRMDNCPARPAVCVSYAASTDCPRNNSQTKPDSA